MLLGTSRFRNIIAISVFIVFVFAEFVYFAKTQIHNVESIGSNEVGESVVKEDKSIFATVSEAYFSDALFIGDSRTEGLSIYKKFDGAVYFCNSSYGVYNGFDRQVDVPDIGVITLRDLLMSRKFAKIYISLGINNLSADFEAHKKRYKEFIDKVMEYQNDAIIILLANMHVTIDQNHDEYINNYSIAKVNAFMNGFADNKKIFYLDVNPCYDDEYGFLPKELCYDGCHVYIKHYDRYIDFLLSHGVIK